MTDHDLGTLIRRTNELLTVLAKSTMAPVLREELRDQQRKELYRLTGGSLSVTEISKKLKLSVGTISNTWQRWEELGLLAKAGKRYRRLLDE
jgi:Fic family protein